MLSIDLSNIVSKYCLTPPMVELLKKEISYLRPNDVLTKVRFAREINLTEELALEILVSLVNCGVLSVVIVVPCLNEEGAHSTWFYSFDEYYQASRDLSCKYCDELLDFQKAKVAFRKGEI